MKEKLIYSWEMGEVFIPEKLLLGEILINPIGIIPAMITQKMFRLSLKR